METSGLLPGKFRVGKNVKGIRKRASHGERFLQKRRAMWIPRAK
jgi:hypothetical protein